MLILGLCEFCLAFYYLHDLTPSKQKDSFEIEEGQPLAALGLLGHSTLGSYTLQISAWRKLSFFFFFFFFCVRVRHISNFDEK
jgi:hypothetical protein